MTAFYPRVPIRSRSRRTSLTGRCSGSSNTASVKRDGPSGRRDAGWQDCSVVTFLSRLKNLPPDVEAKWRAPRQNK